MVYMATKHMLEKDIMMPQPSNPWNPDKSVGSSSRKNNQYSVEIKKNFLRFCVQAMEEKRTPTYEQKIEYLRARIREMPG